MELKAGVRLLSAACDAQVVVVKARPGIDVDLRCGGLPMQVVGELNERGTLVAPGEPVQLGKRYIHGAKEIELLCTASGAGGLSIRDEPFEMNGAKPLPSSD